MTVRDKLVEALLQSEESSKKQADKPKEFAPEFIREWFRVRGLAYFFLFKKNLLVTNMQFAELLALVRRFARSNEGEDIRDLQFSTVNEFNRTVTEIVEGFERNAADPDARFKAIADLYLPLFRRTLVVTYFFGSCALFIPPGLELPLETICGYAGYVHSCGHNVYIRNAYKSTKAEFFGSLDAHVARHLAPSKKTFFTAYAHEDFTPHDRKLATDLRHGLDDVKVFVEKFYMGSEPLGSVIDQMRQKYPQLKIPEPGDFRRTHKKLRSEKAIDQSRTLWLIVDHAIDASLRHPAEKFYFICYDQLWVNENAFQVFDENKPAWVNHTTLPHTLTGAMLNVTAPWWPRDDKPTVVGDPFVGSGTTWLEGSKYKLAEFDCGDNDEIAPLLAQDNLCFFSAPDSKLAEWRSLLRQIDSDFPTAPAPEALEPISPESHRAYLWAGQMFDNLNPGPESDSYSFSQEFVEKLRTQEQGLTFRLFFYLCLRAGLRYREARRRHSINWKKAYLKEASVLCRQISQLLALRKKEREGSHRESLCFFTDDYSQGCSCSRTFLADRCKDIHPPIAVRDATKLPVGKFDVIISDPPYGFNTDADPAYLSHLYSDVITSMIKGLKEEGQIVIALPDWSHTGRQVPFFARKEIVTQQVLVAAEILQREVISGAYMAAAPGNLVRPPYYWESERALRRAILHFRIRTTQKPSGGTELNELQPRN